MKYSVLIFACVICVQAARAQDQVVTLTDGTRVVLKPDRTWEPVPEAKAPQSSGKSMLNVAPDTLTETFAAVQKLDRELKKSEFESEDQYLERIGKLTYNTRVATAGGRKLSETVFFFRDLASYDAERQRFVFSTMPIYLNNRRYGVKGPNYALSFVTRRYGKWYDNTLKLEIHQLSMTGEDAQAAKPTLTVAVYGVPVGYEWSEKQSEVMLAPRRIVVFNLSTGEIYSEQEVPLPNALTFR